MSRYRYIDDYTDVYIYIYRYIDMSICRYIGTVTVSSANSRTSNEESMSYCPGEFSGQDVDQKTHWDKIREARQL